MAFSINGTFLDREATNLNKLLNSQCAPADARENREATKQARKMNQAAYTTATNKVFELTDLLEELESKSLLGDGDGIGCSGGGGGFI